MPSPPTSRSAPTDAVSPSAPPQIETKQPAAGVRPREQRPADDHTRVIQQQRLDAERAQGDMLQARNTAEQAGAARYAPKLFATAQTQERDGRASFGRSEYEVAGRRFRDAQSDYQAATKTAERQTAVALQEVEQARSEIAHARRAAEQAGADRYAASNKMLASANTKQRHGQDALTEHDYAQATTLFRGATADFEAATQSAKAEANADAEMDKLRREVAARRDAAVKAEAPTLAKQLFETAMTREKEAERLAAGRNMDAARQPFQEASSRYDEAARQASTLKEKRPEIPPSPAPTGPSLGRFGPDASSAIQQVLSDLKRAYESKDLALVQRIRPGLRPEDLQSLRNTFDNASKYTLDLRVETIEVRGNDAQARAFRQDVMVAKDGQIYRSEARVTVRFKRVQDRWTIDDIK